MSERCLCLCGSNARSKKQKENRQAFWRLVPSRLLSIFRLGITSQVSKALDKQLARGIVNLLHMRRRRRILGQTMHLELPNPSRGIPVRRFPAMPTTKESTIRQEGKSGTLGRLCKALADQNVNILAYQSSPAEKGKNAVRLVLDNPTAGKTIL